MKNITLESLNLSQNGITFIGVDFIKKAIFKN